MKLIKVAIATALIGAAGIAFAQSPALSVRVISPGSVGVGADRAVATIQLTAGPGDVSVAQLPIAVTGSALADCTLRDTANAAVGTASTQPVNVSAGAVVNLKYVCDVNANGVTTVSVTPASVVATSNGITASVGGLPDGSPNGIVVLGTGVTTPGTPNTGSGDPGSTTPGTPNTGAGGDAAMTWIVLTLSALVAAGAALYTFRQSKA